MFTATGYTGTARLQVYRRPDDNLLRIIINHGGDQTYFVLNPRQEQQLLAQLMSEQPGGAVHYDEEEANDFAEYERLFTENSGGVGED